MEAVAAAGGTRSVGVEQGGEPLVSAQDAGRATCRARGEPQVREALAIPGKDAIAVHVVDVEVQGVAGQVAPQPPSPQMGSWSLYAAVVVIGIGVYFYLSAPKG